jgi:hypothetical protein
LGRLYGGSQARSTFQGTEAFAMNPCDLRAGPKHQPGLSHDGSSKFDIRQHFRTNTAALCVGEGSLRGRALLR